MGSCVLSSKDVIIYEQETSELIHRPGFSPKDTHSICFKDEFDCDTDEKTISMLDNSDEVGESVIDIDTENEKEDCYSNNIRVSFEKMRSRNTKTMASLTLAQDIETPFAKKNCLCLSSNRYSNYSERNHLKCIIADKYKYVFESEKPKYFLQKKIKIGASNRIEQFN